MQERLSRLFLAHGGSPDLGDAKTIDTLRALLHVLEVRARVGGGMRSV